MALAAALELAAAPELLVLSKAAAAAGRSEMISSRKGSERMVLSVAAAELG
jgi:hypothetical protein